MRYTQQRHLESDDGGALISISDMMAGLVFVFIITLAAFIIRFQDAVDTQIAITEEITSINKQRSTLLTTIKEELQKRGVLVEVDHEHGVLRLKESAIRFDVGQAVLTPLGKTNLEIVGEVMAVVLPCYTVERDRLSEEFRCSEAITATLDSILIEGHTDNVPIFNNYFKSNWELSTQRAIETYHVLLVSEPDMLALPNPQKQPLFSVSGYGEGRPVIEHATPTAEAENRRIDFRFIMSPPKVTEPQHDINNQGAT